MEIKILKSDKETLDLEISSLTIVEVLRAYLVEQGANIAAWKRDNPSSNPILHIEGPSPKKLLAKAISQIEKEVDKAIEEFKKLK